MAVEVGMILNGEVTKITDFGAFIKLESKESGLCHVSELSNTFVKNVSDILKVGQEVKVKVIKIDDSRKISLSIKQTEEKQVETTKPVSSPPKNFSRPNDRPREYKSDDRASNSFSKPSIGFEGMLSSFIKTSDEKQSGNKKKAKGSRRGNGHNSNKE